MEKTLLKMLWFKNYYLNNDINLNILNIEPFINEIKFDFDKIFEEKNWNYDKLSFDKSDNTINVYTFEEWYQIQKLYYDVIISYNKIKLEDFFQLIPEIKRIIKNKGIFCFFIEPYPYENKFEEKYYIKKLIMELNNEGFEIKHVSNNSLYSSTKILEYCIIGIGL